MKKFIALMVALMMAAGAFAAVAETTLTEYAVLSEDLYASHINNTNLLSLGNSNEEALAALDGTPLTDYAYRSFSEQMGWIAVTRLADGNTVRRGLLATDGSVVVPADYDDLDVLNENWAVGVMLEDADKSDFDYESWTSDNVYKITTADIFYLPAARKVASLPRENYLRSKAYDHYINVTDRATSLTTVYDSAFNPLQQVGDYFDTSMRPEYSTFNDDGLQGLKAPDGTVILEPTYKIVYADVYDGYFLVGDYDHYGLCDATGKLVVPIEYDSIKLTDGKYVCNGYACVVQDGKVGYVNVQTGEVAMSALSDSTGYNSGVSFNVKDGDTVTVFAADGTQTNFTGISNMMDFDNGLFYTLSDSDNEFGLVDLHGNVILPFDYNYIAVAADGVHLVTRFTSRDPLKVYTMSGDLIPGEAEAPAAAEQPADDEPAAEEAGNGQLEDSAPAPDAMAIEGVDVTGSEAPVAEGSASQDSSVARELLNSAISLLKADPAANSSAAVTLIHNAATQLGGNDTVINQLNSVITLLNADATANGAAAVSLLESLLPLL